ncbi:hypothetical protein [Streptomyces sp. URMC 129]|uniref:hypothetical protein n=1 Tax=Streptomyces sp. URMC 129 TaxID=3423407 RepID=UPI003F19AB6A
MSEYGFNDYADGGQEQGQGSQEPKWFRDRMDKLAGEVSELRAENERLQAERRQSQVAETLRAKGYSPSGAKLFTGEPEKLDDWLTANGDALARLPQAPAGPPPSTVPADQQDQMRLISEAGATGVAPPQGAEAELVNRLANASPEEFAQIMQANGSPFSW